MLNFKKLFIPSGSKKEITEIESWTVTWGVYTGWTEAKRYHSKVFITQEDAYEFQKQLKESATFTKAYLTSNITKN